MSIALQNLLLAPVMAQRAHELDAAFPGVVVFTSGRRSLHAQAHAMAVNHCLDPRSYLVRQYIHAAEFLVALDAQPEATSVDEITEVFYDLLRAEPSLIKSPHLDGHAVDLCPMERPDGTPTAQGGLVILWIRACVDTTDFRTREGTLKRWHWACVPIQKDA